MLKYWTYNLSICVDVVCVFWFLFFPFFVSKHISKYLLFECWTTPKYDTHTHTYTYTSKCNNDLFDENFATLSFHWQFHSQLCAYIGTDDCEYLMVAVVLRITYVYGRYTVAIVAYDMKSALESIKLIPSSFLLVVDRWRWCNHRTNLIESAQCTPTFRTCNNAAFIGKINQKTQFWEIFLLKIVFLFARLFVTNCNNYDF